MTTTELPASHCKTLNKGRIRKLQRRLNSLDAQLRTRRDAIQEQQTIIYGLLKTRERLDKQLFEAAKEPPPPSQPSPDTHFVNHDD